MKRHAIGIVGYGMVGAAVGAWFKTAAKYDLKKFPDGLTAVNRADIVFICVPTPYKKSTGYDYRAIEQTAKKLTGHKIIVLKSTVLPGQTAKFQKNFPQHTWLFNPEFLRDKTATKDFLKPDRQIVGYARTTTKHRAAARLVMKLLPPAPYQAITTSTEAELIKQFANAFLATKVVFANMMYDVAKRLGADYEQVKLGVGNDPRITTSMMQIFLDGFRGYSGKCFPKDMGALIRYGQITKHRLPLLEIADSINWKLLPKQRRQR
jgi:UDPglucose 6-dehydrogenase